MTWSTLVVKDEDQGPCVRGDPALAVGCVRADMKENENRKNRESQVLIARVRFYKITRCLFLEWSGGQACVTLVDYKVRQLARDIKSGPVRVVRLSFGGVRHFAAPSTAGCSGTKSGQVTPNSKNGVVLSRL
jgi:hypothetical protein